GLLLTAATAVAAVADVPLSGGAGDRYWQPTGPSTLERTYELAAGDATLDLRQLDVGARTEHVTVHVGFGDLRIWVPDGVHLVIDAHAGLGDVRVLGSVDHGVDVSRRADVSGSSGTIEIDARVGMGQVEVIR
ncbi:MAG: PspC protein, partial [Actinomycetia bacterium]|nr:PspC protein [Actinomycetes bacterium]